MTLRDGIKKTEGNPNEETLTAQGGFMRQASLAALAASCATIAVAMFLSAHIVRGQSPSAARSAPDYNPYPPEILPSDLSSEVARVQREVDLLETRALARWKGLGRPILTGQ